MAVRVGVISSAPPPPLNITAINHIVPSACVVNTHLLDSYSISSRYWALIASINLIASSSALCPASLHISPCPLRMCSISNYKLVNKSKSSAQVGVRVEWGLVLSSACE